MLKCYRACCSLLLSRRIVWLIRGWSDKMHLIYLLVWKRACLINAWAYTDAWCTLCFLLLLQEITYCKYSHWLHWSHWQIRHFSTTLISAAAGSFFLGSWRWKAELWQLCCTTPSKKYITANMNAWFYSLSCWKRRSPLIEDYLSPHYLTTGAECWQLQPVIWPSHNVIKSPFLCFATPPLHDHCRIYLSLHRPSWLCLIWSTQKYFMPRRAALQLWPLHKQIFWVA